jgi:thioesterase domain-containing protein
MPPEVLAHYLEQIYGEAYRTYDATAYSGMVTLFRAQERGHHRDVDPTLGWSDVPLGGLDVISVPGPHGLMVREPFVATLAKELRRVIDCAMAQRGGAAPIATTSTTRRSGTR